MHVYPDNFLDVFNPSLHRIDGVGKHFFYFPLCDSMTRATELNTKIIMSVTETISK